MQTKIKLTKILDNNIYAQYEGVYLGEQEVKVNCSGMYGENISTKLLSNSNVRINIDCVKNHHFLLETNYIVSCTNEIYCKNINECILLNITKVYGISAL